MNLNHKGMPKGLIFPLAVLSNDKIVINFSSPHSFEFEDGTILNACHPDHCLLLSMDAVETPINEQGDITIAFRMDSFIEYTVGELMKLYNTYKEKNKSLIVFVPLPMITALKESGFDILNSPFRTIRMVNRITKKVSIHKQCC